MENKTVAKHVITFISGKPAVTRYYNTDKSKQVDIMTCKNPSNPKIGVLSTIGVHNIDIGMKYKDTSLRVELMLTGDIQSDILENILSSAAFEIMDSAVCKYGTIIPNVISPYLKNTEMKHLLMMSPVFWEKYAPLHDSGTTVSWLFGVPISEKERDFIRNRGVDEFDKLLEEKKADVLNYTRGSII
jgi:hypothetical protein